MTKLNQVIAIEKGVKSRTYAVMNELHKQVQKVAMFTGFHKEYKRLNDNTEELPAEGQRVQQRAWEVVRQFAAQQTEIMDVTARKDFANCYAKADIVVDGTTIINAVPVTYLLFLEKQMTDFRTFAAALPVLEETEDWGTAPDPASGLWKTSPSPTHKTKKMVRPIVKYDATPEHPAQTELITEDILVGHWYMTKHSGAIPRSARDGLVARVDKLLMAIKEAREEANSVDIDDDDIKVGDHIFSYVLNGA